MKVPYLPYCGNSVALFHREMAIADPEPPAPYALRNGVVLDPFVGSGTSLVEAARLGLPACGGDLNPAAWPWRGPTGWSTWTQPSLAVVPGCC